LIYGQDGSGRWIGAQFWSGLVWSGLVWSGLVGEYARGYPPG
jgi:hypothetical protein